MEGLWSVFDMLLMEGLLSIFDILLVEGLWSIFGTSVIKGLWYLSEFDMLDISFYSKPLSTSQVGERVYLVSKFD